MKKLLFLALPVLAMVFVSCSKDKDKDKNNASGLRNEVVFDGKTYAIESAEMTYYGKQNDNNTSKVNLEIKCNGMSVEFNMFIPGSATRLAPGTYCFDYNGEAFTLGNGYVTYDYYGYGRRSLEITSGEVKVDLSGTTYAVIFDCGILSGGEPVAGSYVGGIKFKSSRY